MKLEGELREIDLVAKLIELSDERFTGALRFENETDSVIKIIYFKDGNVLSASTNDRADSIDEILLKSSKVSKEHIKQALAKRKENETLGDALLSLGFITRKELAWVRRVQLIGIIRSLQRWNEGTYTVVADYLPKREEGTIFNLPQVVVEVIVTEQDRSHIESALGGSEAIFQKSSNAEARYRTLGLNEDADAIFQRVDGRATVSEIAASSGMDEFSVFKLMYAFRALGVVETGFVKPQVNDEVSFSFDDPPPLESLPTLGGLDAVPTPAVDDHFAASPLDTPSPADLAIDDADWDVKSSSNEPTVALPLPERFERLDTPLASIEPEMEHTYEDEYRPTILTQPKRGAQRSRLPLILGGLLLLLAAGGFAAWKFLIPHVDGPDVAAAPPRPASAASAPAAVPVVTESAITETSPTTATDSATTTSVSSAGSLPPTATDRASAATTSAATPAPVPPVPTPTPTVASVPAAASNSDRARLEQRGREFAAESATVPYAVQIAFLCEVNSVRAAVESGGSAVWFVPVERGGKTCFRVFHGRYASRTEALRGTSAVPAEYRTSRPVVVKVADVVKR